ncbi:MAG: 3-phosphoshikimate 1-carboxyvinyltransferase [Ilumatobacteraceae bacterium]
MVVHRIAPLGAPVHATVRVPGSKSIANRALVCAALADGESVLVGLPGGDDTAAMIEGLRALGLEIETSTGDGDEDGLTATVVGGQAHLRRGPVTINARLAGTTSRFLTAFAALAPGPCTIDGAGPLRSRPMAPLHDALRAIGVRVSSTGTAGHLPVVVQGPPHDDVEEVSLPGDVSSQFLSALMMIAPLLPNGLRFRLTTRLVSRPYVRITASVMESFGIGGIELGDRIITVPHGSYRPCSYRVEPDASSASYPLGLAAICGGAVRVEGLTDHSVQGDAAFCHVLERMGCEVLQDDVGTVIRRTSALRGIGVDMGDISDLVPTMAVVAAFAEGTTEIHGIGFIRGKESDRIGDLCAELRKAGVGAEERPDGLVIHPGPTRPATLGTHHDHRLAMAFALLGMGAGDIIIEDPDVVTKSWPGFWDAMEAMR